MVAEALRTRCISNEEFETVLDEAVELHRKVEHSNPPRLGALASAGFTHGFTGLASRHRGRLGIRSVRPSIASLWRGFSASDPLLLGNGAGCMTRTRAWTRASLTRLRV